MDKRGADKSGTTQQAAYLAATAAAALRQGETIGRWSLLLGCSGFVILWASLLSPTFELSTLGKYTLLASLTVALIQLYFCLRVGLDAQLFSLWAKAIDRLDGEAAEPEIQTHLTWLDGSLVTLGLLAQMPTKPRALDQRAKGAMALLRRQMAALLSQVILLGLATLLALTHAA
jgi:hypothetical protein